MQHDEVGGQHASTGAAPACRMAAAHDWPSRSLLPLAAGDMAGDYARPLQLQGQDQDAELLPQRVQRHRCAGGGEGRRRQRQRHGVAALLLPFPHWQPPPACTWGAVLPCARGLSRSTPLLLRCFCPLVQACATAAAAHWPTAATRRSKRRPAAATCTSKPSSGHTHPRTCGRRSG